MSNVDFTIIGMQKSESEFLNWCLKYRTNLEKQKKDKVMEIWEQENAEGNAILSFNRKGVTLRTSKSLFN